MLTKLFDFHLASYHSLDEIVLEEIQQADLIEIRGLVKGGIYHSQAARWLGNVSGITDSKEMIRSKKERKVSDETKAWFLKKGYRFEIVKMNKTRFREFVRLYSATTLQQERPMHFSLEEQILNKIVAGVPVYLVGMFKQKKLESGLVFSLSGKQAVVSFGAKKKFEERRGGVGGVLELMLVDFCLQHQISEISHGKSRNPAGISSKAGVFEFKARYGFSAFPEGAWKTTFITNPKVALTDLVFVTLLKDQVGYLVVSKQKEVTSLKKFQTKEVDKIQLMSLDQVVRSGKRFVKQMMRELE